MTNNNEILNIIFKVSEEIEYEISEDKVVTIAEKQNHKIQQFFRKLKFKIPMYKKTELDEYSSDVFLQINGEKTVKEIGEYLDLKYGEKAHPIYERLLLFLNHIEVNCNYIKRVN